MTGGPLLLVVRRHCTSHPLAALLSPKEQQRHLVGSRIPPVVLKTYSLRSHCAPRRCGEQERRVWTSSVVDWHVMSESYAISCARGTPSAARTTPRSGARRRRSQAEQLLGPPGPPDRLAGSVARQAYHMVCALVRAAGGDGAPPAAASNRSSWGSRGMCATRGAAVLVRRVSFLD